MSEIDLPQPMVGLKPARKRQTAADRFTVEHQEQYEAHARNPDQIEWVKQHNNTYPKMRNELDKKKDARSNHKVTRSKNELDKRKETTRSIHKVAKPSTSRQSRPHSRHPEGSALKPRASSESGYCSECRRLIRAQLINDGVPRRTGRRSILKRSYTKYRMQRSRRNHDKYHPHSSRPKGLKPRTLNMDATGNPSDVTIKTMDSEDEENGYEDEKRHNSRKENRAGPITIRNSSSTVVASKYKNKNYDHNDSRGTSYHSYHSMNHEPML